MQIILKAAYFAAKKHSKQRRKDRDATPYINHPIEVAHTLATVGKVKDLNLLAAALLHDTLEDTATGEDEIELEFGPNVLSIVREVTDDKRLSKARRKRLQVERAGKISAEAKQLKIADKICNLKSLLNTPPEDWPRERIVDYFLWTMEVFNGLKGINSALDVEFMRIFKEGEDKFKM